MNTNARPWKRVVAMLIICALVLSIVPVQFTPDTVIENENSSPSRDPEDIWDRPVVTGSRGIGLHALYVGNTEIDIEWSIYTGENFSSYRVLDDGFEVKNITKNTTTSMRFQIREKHQTYTFRVEVFDTKSEVVSSDEITVKTGLVRGTIRRDTSWSSDDEPYNLTDDIIIENGTLYVFENVEVRGADHWIETRGGNLRELRDVTLNSIGVSLKHQPNFRLMSSNLTNSRVELTSCEKFWIRDLNMTGSTIGAWYTNRSQVVNNSIQNVDDGIILVEAVNSTVSKNRLNNTKDGIYLEWADGSVVSENVVNNSETGISFEFCNGVEVTKNMVSNSEEGMFLYFASDVKIDNNTVQDSTDGFVLREASSVKVTNITCPGMSDHVVNAESVSNCTFENLTGTLLLDGSFSSLVRGHWGDITLKNSERNNVTECNKPVGHNHTISLISSNNNIVKNNFFWHNTGTGISLTSSHNNTVANNTMVWNTVNGISMVNSNGNTIYYNTIYNNSLNGIMAFGNGNNFSGNTVRGNVEYGMRLTGSNNLVDDCDFTENENGFYLEGSGNTLSNSFFEQNSKDGIYLYSGSSENVIRNNSIKENNQGIFLFGDNNENLISENTIYNNRDYGIYFQLPSSENIIEENNISRTGLSGSAYGDGIHMQSACTNTSIWDNDINRNNGNGMTLRGTGHDIDGNTLIANSNIGIYLLHSSKSTVNNNTVDLHLQEGIFLQESSGNNVTKNTVTMCNRGIFVFSNSDDNYVTYNKLMSNNVQGIYVMDSDGESINWNNASFNKLGIVVSDSDSNTVGGNEVWSNEEQGIQLWDSYDTWVTENTVSGNAYGIRLWASNLNEIEDNDIINNTYGIDLWEYSDDNKFTANMIKKNDWGIYIWGSHASDGNVIYDNYFENQKNAYDNSDNHNTWNISKTSGTNIAYGPFIGGNYWHDFQGTDTDGDFLGDNGLPYNSGGKIANGGDLRPLIPKAIQVKNLQTGFVYSTISEALDDPATEDDHTIMVGPGEYVETIDITKTVILRSTEGPEATIIRSPQANVDTVLMSGRGAELVGFTITGSTGNGKAGIRVSGSDCDVMDCIITENEDGIVLADSIGVDFNLDNTTITNNQGHGLYGHSLSDIVPLNILNSDITKNGGGGILIELGTTIRFYGMNVVSENGCGKGAGSAIRGYAIDIEQMIGMENRLICNANEGNGIETESIKTPHGSTNVALEVKGNHGHGILNAVDINLRNADISENLKDGINSLNKAKVTFQLSQCTISKNVWNGIATQDSKIVHLILEAEPVAGGSTAVTENRQTGIKLGINGVVDVRGPTLVGHNWGTGISAGALISDIEIHVKARLDVSTNRETGIFTERGGDPGWFKDHVTKPGSVEGGEISSFNNGEYGIYADGDVIFDNGLVANNVDWGIVCYGRLSLKAVKIMGNGGGGIWTPNSEGTRTRSVSGSVDAPATIDGHRADGDGTDGSIFDCTISENNGTAILIEDGSSPEIIGNTITENGNGIHCTNGSAPVIRFNSFEDNAGFDIRNDDDTVTIDAKRNWWGTPSELGATTIGNVNNSSPLSSEVDENDNLVMNGYGLTDLLNETLTIEYSVQTGSNVTLTILRFQGGPMGTHSNATGGIHVVMVSNTDAVNEISFWIYYQRDELPNEGDEERLKPIFWHDDGWHIFSDWTPYSGTGDPYITVTINSSTTPAITQLNELNFALMVIIDDGTWVPDPEDPDDEDDDDVLLQFILVFIIVAVLLVILFKKKIRDADGGDSDTTANPDSDTSPPSDEMNKGELLGVIVKGSGEGETTTENDGGTEGDDDDEDRKEKAASPPASKTSGPEPAKMTKADIINGALR